jgi:hypothetical protein
MATSRHGVNGVFEFGSGNVANWTTEGKTQLDRPMETMVNGELMQTLRAAII